LWRSIIADITGRNICIPENTEASVLGAGITAAAGSGWYRTAHGAAQKMSRTALIVRPDKKCRKTYQQRLAAYRKLYPKLKSV
jgi:sugar (pentulose or hexulose) kinase